MVNNTTISISLCIFLPLLNPVTDLNTAPVIPFLLPLVLLPRDCRPSHQQMESYSYPIGSGWASWLPLADRPRHAGYRAGSKSVLHLFSCSPAEPLCRSPSHSHCKMRFLRRSSSTGPRGGHCGPTGPRLPGTRPGQHRSKPKSGKPSTDQNIISQFQFPFPARGAMSPISDCRFRSSKC